MAPDPHGRAPRRSPGVALGLALGLPLASSLAWSLVTASPVRAQSSGVTASVVGPANPTGLPEPDLEALGVPRYPGMELMMGTGTLSPVNAGREAQRPAGGTPASSSANTIPEAAPPHAGPDATPATPDRGGGSIVGIALYVTSAKYDDVVAFYERGLKTRARDGRPVDLAASYPGVKIPRGVEGRTAFLQAKRALDSGEVPESLPELEARLLNKVLGEVTVMVRDYYREPKTHAIREDTTITIFKFRPVEVPTVDPGTGFTFPYPDRPRR